MDCEVIFTPGEWKSVYAILDLPEPAEGCPKLHDVVRAIARLGGFIDRPKNNPGAQTLWRGLQRAFDLSTAWEAFGPGAKKNLPELLVMYNEGRARWKSVSFMTVKRWTKITIARMAKTASQ